MFFSFLFAYGKSSARVIQKQRERERERERENLALQSRWPAGVSDLLSNKFVSPSMQYSSRQERKKGSKEVAAIFERWEQKGRPTVHLSLPGGEREGRHKTYGRSTSKFPF